MTINLDKLVCMFTLVPYIFDVVCLYVRCDEHGLMGDSLMFGLYGFVCMYGCMWLMLT